MGNDFAGAMRNEKERKEKRNDVPCSTQAQRVRQQQQQPQHHVFYLEWDDGSLHGNGAGRYTFCCCGEGSLVHVSNAMAMAVG